MGRGSRRGQPAPSRVTVSIFGPAPRGSELEFTQVVPKAGAEISIEVRPVSPVCGGPGRMGGDPARRQSVGARVPPSWAQNLTTWATKAPPHGRVRGLLVEKERPEMAKKAAVKMKLQIKAGQANPSPARWPRPGSARHQHHGILQGVQRPRPQTWNRARPCPTVITYYFGTSPSRWRSRRRRRRISSRRPPASSRRASRNRPRGGDKPGRETIATDHAGPQDWREIAYRQDGPISARKRR